MAIYEVAHACGHTQEHQIYGTDVHGERDREAARLARRDCSPCYAARRDAERQELTAAAVDVESLPALTGSERQVAWAEKIRTDGIARIVEEVRRAPTGYGRAVRAVTTGHRAPLFGPQLDRLAVADRDEVARLLIAAAVAQTSASWWIDNRSAIPYAAMDVMSEDGHARVATLLGHP